MKRIIALLLALIVAIFACLGVAHSIQTDGGKIQVSRGTIVTDVGDLTYKLYEPATATAENPAPGVLLLHGYQNDSETCAAYAIELARRGAVVEWLPSQMISPYMVRRRKAAPTSPLANHVR